MKMMLTGGACALFAMMAHSAYAQDTSDTPASEMPARTGDGDDRIEVVQQLLTPSAGLMNDHMHEGGEIMLGLRFERQRHAGANRSGTTKLADSAIHAAGFTSRATSMEMDMLMLDVMFAPNDDITLMIMPHYMWHRMEMVGIDPAVSGMPGEHDGGHDDAGHGGEHGAGHGALPYGEVHAHGAKGFGDTLVSASYRLVRRPGLRAHATLGLWVPTGKNGLKNPDGSYVHYGTQPGSGTWDVEPVLTVSGNKGAWGWGGQAAYRWRTESANSAGFAFGDKVRATGWASYLLTRRLGTTARLEYVHEGAIEGHYNGPHHHSSPSDIQQNYGGDSLFAGLGINWLLPTGGSRSPQLGVEAGVPLWQDLNGIQLPQDWRLSVALTNTF